VAQVANNARKAVTDAINAENLACYYEGDQELRRQAQEIKETAMDLIYELERIAKS
jgi:hypothetical protein